MIGGIDIRFKSAAGQESLEIAARAIAQLWPNAVFAHGETGERYDYVWLIPFSEMDEVFVYRESNSADVWFEKGAVPEAYNTMIHVLHDTGLLTIVIDERNQEMDTILRAIKSGLADDIHSVCAV
jgi:hypothetical protein